MNKQGITVDIDCRLTVSRETAETCMRLVEIFINTNKGFGIHDVENADGSISFFLIDYTERKAEQTVE